MHEDVAFDAGGHDERVDGMDKGGVHDGLVTFLWGNHVESKLKLSAMDIQ